MDARDRPVHHHVRRPRAPRNPTHKQSHATEKVSRRPRCAQHQHHQGDRLRQPAIETGQRLSIRGANVRFRRSRGLRPPARCCASGASSLGARAASASAPSLLRWWPCREILGLPARAVNPYTRRPKSVRGLLLRVGVEPVLLHERLQHGVHRHDQKTTLAGCEGPHIIRQPPKAQVVHPGCEPGVLVVHVARQPDHARWIECTITTSPAVASRSSSPATCRNGSFARDGSV